MDYLQRLARQFKLRLFLAILLTNTLLIVCVWLELNVLKLHGATLYGLLIAAALVVATFACLWLSNNLIQPIKAIWQAIAHLEPNSIGTQPPKAESLSTGKELVVNLLDRIYQLISSADKLNSETSLKLKDLGNNFIAQNLPLPMMVLDDNENIKYLNNCAAQYLGFKAEDLVGKNVYMILDMSFPSEDTFDTWLKKAKSTSATAAMTWERVKLDVRDNHPQLLFDLAAYYNRDNSDNNQTIIIMFDHTKQYSQEEQAISYVALSVHELRAPLTLLRGYIEVFEDELEGKMSPELVSFMEKMHAQAEQLMAFVNNILNVARIDDDQLQLKLEETDWANVLTASVESISIRAKVRGIRLNCSVAENLPTVGVDRLSIQEVISNLIDNAIKYSGKGHEINIDSRLTSEGFVETTVQDFGLGIQSAILPNLFTKFYRDYHNRSQIGGTGLGLYLSKAIVKAHGGHIWVKSKEGEGSTFGFTIQPFASLKKDMQSPEEQLITEAHGWIKNHSLYRR
jgi:signal transduction histidine kinase